LKWQNVALTTSNRPVAIGTTPKAVEFRRIVIYRSPIEVIRYSQKADYANAT